MQYPSVQLVVGDSVEDAVEKISAAAGNAGLELYSMHAVNALHPLCEVCQFFQTRFDGRDAIVVVMVGEWDDERLIRILNILLEIRLEVGTQRLAPLFRIHSAHPLPSVVSTLFADGPVGAFECRAVPVVGFGSDVSPHSALHLATVAKYLLREVFAVEVDFWSDSGEQSIAQVMRERLAVESFPEDGAPLNTLIALGFLFGERQRARYRYVSHWVQLKELGPWPGVIFTNEQQDEGGGDDPEDGAERAVRRVAFSPISIVLSAYQQSVPDVLVRAAAELARRCESELGPAP